MRSAVAAFALAGAASAAWAPPQGYTSGTWGESSAPAPPAPVSSAPAYSSPAAPVSSAPAVYTTQVVTAYTTYCPEATEITHSGITYTATEATTLTITNCPGGCTVTYPVSTPVVSAPVTSVPAVSTVVPVPYPSGNASVPVVSTAAPIGTSATQSYGATGSPIASAPPATGGAAKSYSTVGATIAAIFALFATL